MAAEQAVRAFARHHPTPNVQRAVEAAEDGLVTWEQVEGLFVKALEDGLKQVAAEAAAHTP